MPHGILYDSDFVISLLVPDQSTHAKALAISAAYQKHKVYMLRLISYEIATVLSRIHSQTLALQISEAFDQMNIHYLTLNNDEEVWAEFRTHTHKSISFFDCANLVAARKFGLKIASFDGFYPKDMVLT